MAKRVVATNVEEAKFLFLTGLGQIKWEASPTAETGEGLFREWLGLMGEALVAVATENPRRWDSRIPETPFRSRVPSVGVELASRLLVTDVKYSGGLYRYLFEMPANLFAGPELVRLVGVMGRYGVRVHDTLLVRATYVALGD